LPPKRHLFLLRSRFWNSSQDLVLPREKGHYLPTFWEGGHECIANVEKFLDLEGPMVLQDLPKVVENASVGERIEKMGNDFFTGQQIKGTY
jgi:hypothetical protein